VTDLKSLTPAEILDVQGMSCPYPIILIKKQMQNLPSGSILKILCDSQVTAEEVITHYCERRGYEFESVKIEDGYWECYIRKT
jgi:TusA-related sulfurtransferase